MGWRGPMTARQFWAWQDWISEDMDRPDKTEWYLMQIAEYVKCSITKDFSDFDLSKQKIKFEPVNGKPDSKKTSQLKRDPETGIYDPYADETDDEREARYRKQYGEVVDVFSLDARFRGEEQ